MTGYASRKQRCSRVVPQPHQRVINNLDRVAAYLDDMIVFDADPSLHVANVREFFLRMRKHNLKFSPSTATIGATDADFLRHTISPAGVMPNAQEVEAVTKIPHANIPETATLPFGRSFRLQETPARYGKAHTAHHFPSEARRQVRFYSSNGNHRVETPGQADHAPGLVYPNWNAVTDHSRPFLLYYDASVDGFGFTLEQEQDDHTIPPIVFISRAINESERH